MAAPCEGDGKRALITGLGGFTGRYLAPELRAAGYRVFGKAVPHEAPGGDGGGVDLCDRHSVARLVAQVQPDVVAHLAGVAFVGDPDVERIYNVNILGTRNLLDALAALRRRPRAVLIASSANVYGNATSGVIDERVPPAPSNDYAVSKLAMEHMAQLFGDRLPIVIARPFNYTGVGQAENFLLPKIVSHFRQRAHHIDLGNLSIARDFSDVRTVALKYRRLLAASPAGQAFNVCSGRAYSLASVLGMMARIAGYEIDVRINPALVRANDVLTLVGSDDKLCSVIGPIAPIALDDTLRWMYQA
jgi:nucleoside-diphosphate-sugar epimerase